MPPRRSLGDISLGWFREEEQKAMTRLRNYGTVRVLAEPMGSERQREVAITDVRLEKTFGLGGPLQASGMLDFFNLFNNNAEERISWQSGSYLRPLQVIPPRVARVSVRLSF